MITLTSPQCSSLRKILVTSIITGEDLTQAIARIQELAIKQQSDNLEPQK
ncbi:MAG: hypothetical protein RMY36_030955 [Nostoc sp. SerVER01]|nr:hypothetical protein [Nostoc sp. SerVER01]